MPVRVTDTGHFSCPLISFCFACSSFPLIQTTHILVLFHSSFIYICVLSGVFILYAYLYCALFTHLNLCVLFFVSSFPPAEARETAPGWRAPYGANQKQNVIRLLFSLSLANSIECQSSVSKCQSLILSGESVIYSLHFLSRYLSLNQMILL